MPGCHDYIVAASLMPTLMSHEVLSTTMPEPAEDNFSCCVISRNNGNGRRLCQDVAQEGTLFGNCLKISDEIGKKKSNEAFKKCDISMGLPQCAQFSSKGQSPPQTTTKHGLPVSRGRFTLVPIQGEQIHTAASKNDDIPVCALWVERLNGGGPKMPTAMARCYTAPVPSTMEGFNPVREMMHVNSDFAHKTRHYPPTDVLSFSDVMQSNKSIHGASGKHNEHSVIAEAMTETMGFTHLQRSMAPSVQIEHQSNISATGRSEEDYLKGLASAVITEHATLQQRWHDTTQTMNQFISNISQSVQLQNENLDRHLAKIDNRLCRSGHILARIVSQLVQNGAQKKGDERLSLANSIFLSYVEAQKLQQENIILRKALMAKG